MPGEVKEIASPILSASFAGLDAWLVGGVI
jgi:hypothetical protein